MEAFKKILIINPYGIGDALFTTPVISNLRLDLPGSSIAYLANQRTADFLKFNPDITKVFVYDRDEFVAVYRRSPLKFVQKWFEFASSIKQEGFDLVLDISLNSTFGFLCAVCGIKRRVGFNYRNRGRFLTDKIPFTGYEDKHIIEYNLDLLRHLQIPVSTRQMTFNIPSRDIQWAKEWLTDHKIDPAKPLIAVLPGGGASWGKDARNRRWPTSKYADLVDKIIENFDRNSNIIGTPVDLHYLLLQVFALVINTVA